MVVLDLRHEMGPTNMFRRSASVGQLSWCIGWLLGLISVLTCGRIAVWLRAISRFTSKCITGLNSHTSLVGWYSEQLSDCAYCGCAKSPFSYCSADR